MFKSSMEEYWIMEIKRKRERKKEKSSKICKRNFNIHCDPSIFQINKD